MTARRPLVMGILNVTPDSFSDGGRLASADAAVASGLLMIEQGADIIDIGGESTRPGATPVDANDEMDRVLPVIAGLRARTDQSISIDTMKPDVAEAAVAAGATIWNDIAGLRAAGALETAARLGCEVVITHMRGEPSTMQLDPVYADVSLEVADWLAARARAAVAAGVARDRIRLDPGIGFGKTAPHNLALTRDLHRMVDLGFPVVYGASRKRTIQAIDPRAMNAGDRLGGSLALALEAARRGAAIIRVHDVRETVQALEVQAALAGADRE